MHYQYKGEPLTWDEANRLANVCQIHEEKLIIFLERFEFQKQQNQLLIR